MPIAHFTADAVAFDTAQAASDTVQRSGKFFEVGQVFKDKNGLEFGLMTEAEADAAIAAFEPVPLSYEHEESLWDGLLGDITALRREGKDIIAEYAFPRLLHEHMGGKSLPISSEWDIQTKRPTGGSIVLRPAVKDAVMMSAVESGTVTADHVARFAMTRHNTPQGQTVMQELHDATARAGAVCDRGNVAQMASQHESTTLQKIHDMTADHGAKCASGDAPPWVRSNFSTNKPASPVIHRGEKTMNPIIAAFNKLRAAHKASGAPVDDIPELTDADLPAQTAQFSAAQTAEFSAMKSELARIRQESAQTFVDGLKANGQIMPFEEKDILAEFAQASADDAVLTTTVKFSALDDDMKPVEKMGTRVDAVKARYSRRPSNGMTRELVAHGRALTQDDVTAYFARPTAKETEEQLQKRIDAVVAAERAAHGLPAPK